MPAGGPSSARDGETLAFSVMRRRQLANGAEFRKLLRQLLQRGAQGPLRLNGLPSEYELLGHKKLGRVGDSKAMLEQRRDETQVQAQKGRRLLVHVFVERSDFVGRLAADREGRLLEAERLHTPFERARHKNACGGKRAKWGKR